MANHKENIWWLSHGARYSDRATQPSGMPEISSRHAFGWDRNAEAFVMRSRQGQGVMISRHLFVPIELAEMFLVRCLDKTFSRRFLIDLAAKDTVTESFEAKDMKLIVERGPVRQSSIMFEAAGLVLSLESEGKRQSDNIVLFHEMRLRLALELRSLSVAAVRANLRERPKS